MQDLWCFRSDWQPTLNSSQKNRLLMNDNFINISWEVWNHLLKQRFVIKNKTLMMNKKNFVHFTSWHLKKNCQALWLHRSHCLYIHLNLHQSKNGFGPLPFDFCHTSLWIKKNQTSTMNIFGKKLVLWPTSCFEQYKEPLLPRRQNLVLLNSDR